MDIILSIDFLVREFALFAAFWLLLGAVDDVAIDIIYLRFFAPWRHKADAAIAPIADKSGRHMPKSCKSFALFIPLWQEQAVITNTLRNMAAQWQHADLRIYVGCYPNDSGTIRAVMQAADDPRVRIVINAAPGPTTKAQCLNRLWQALCDDEYDEGRPFDAIILHDAEDRVHMAAPAIFSHYLQDYDMVQLPVLPKIYPGSPMISGHYCDEFAEAHGKFMPVRQALGASMPLAGVGCAISRNSLQRLVQRQNSGLNGPFSEQSLTEDYELGIRLHNAGARSHFVTEYDDAGALVATRAYFPHELSAAVRQKSRWTAGIALSGWDRLGWYSPQMQQSHGAYPAAAKQARWCEYWMRLRDRRAMMSALVLLAAYAALLGSAFLAFAQHQGWYIAAPYSTSFLMLLSANALFLLWRLVMRCCFTYRHYGAYQAILSVPRMFIANIISIMAARRAFMLYCRLLFGQPVAWDKTAHILPYAEHMPLARSIAQGRQRL